MYKRKASTVVILISGIGFLAAGCSSSSSTSAATSPSATITASPSAAATSAAATSAAATSATSAGSSGPVTAADCTIIKPISASAVSTLIPLQTDSKTKAAAAIKAYVAQLTTAESKVTSAKGKADLNALITALEKSETESKAAATTAMTAALGKVGSACP
jgi:hypothetical protein